MQTQPTEHAQYSVPSTKSMLRLCAIVTLFAAILIGQLAVAPIVPALLYGITGALVICLL